MTDLAKRIRQSAQRSLDNPAFVYGRRTEELFERVVASLGRCQLLRREDSGGLFFNASVDVSPPDFRVVLEDGSQMLIEVKNFDQQKSPFKDYRLAAAKYDSLVAYAALIKCPLFFATFWVRWNCWTLVPADVFERHASYVSIAMSESLTRSEMNLLGDLLIGTPWPIRIRLLADREHPRKLSAKGEGSFNVAGVEILSDDVALDNPREQSIAWLLAVFGDWRADEPRLEREGEEAKYLEYFFSPRDPERRSERGSASCDIIGTFSSMISRMHAAETTTDGVVTGTRANFKPGVFRDLIPNPRNEDGLKLAVITISPRSE